LRGEELFKDGDYHLEVSNGGTQELDGPGCFFLGIPSF